MPIVQGKMENHGKKIKVVQIFVENSNWCGLLWRTGDSRFMPLPVEIKSVLNIIKKLISPTTENIGSMNAILFFVLIIIASIIDSA